MNMEEEKDMYIVSVDESNGLMQQKADGNKEDRGKAKNRIVEVGGNVNIMINKNISNDESKASNKDQVSTASNHGTSIVKLF